MVTHHHSTSTRTAALIRLLEIRLGCVVSIHGTALSRVLQLSAELCRAIPVWCQTLPPRSPTHIGVFDLLGQLRDHRGRHYHLSPPMPLHPRSGWCVEVPP